MCARFDRLLLGVTDYIQGQKMPKKLIHVAQKNFLTVQIMEKKRQEPKAHGEVQGKLGGIKDVVKQTVGAKNTNGRSAHIFRWMDKMSIFLSVTWSGCFWVVSF
jgi:hypothetical protein